MLDVQKIIHEKGLHGLGLALQAEREYLSSKGWLAFGRGWLDALAFEAEGFMAPVVLVHDALAIQRARDEEEALALPEVQRARLLSVLSTRKRGPVPLEQHRAGLLFLLERRAIRMVEDGKSV